MRKLSFAAAGLMAMLCIIPVINSKAAQTYDVIFRAGSHGELSTDGSSWSDKVVKEARAGGEFPGTPPEVRSTDENYIFTGWNKEIDVDSPVTEKQIYVAQFTLKTEGQEYIVKYVTSDGTEVATPKIAIGEIGTTVEGYAENIAGYTLDQKKKSMVLTKNSTEIRFIYTPEKKEPSTNAPQTNAPQTNAPQTNTPQTNAPSTNAPQTNAPNITKPSGNTTTSGGSTGNGNQDVNGDNTEQEQDNITIPDENPPLAKEPEPDTEMVSETQTLKIQDEEVPLAKAPEAESGNWGWAVGGAVVVLLSGGTGVGLFIKKRRSS